MYGRTDHRLAPDWRGVALGAILVLSGHLQAQTLAEVAEAQRSKVLAEIAAAEAAAHPAPVRPEKPVDPSKSGKARAGRIMVHSLYARGNGGWTAELTDGSTLSVAEPGMRVGRYVVQGIDAGGLHLRAYGKCQTACERRVRLGEAL